VESLSETFSIIAKHESKLGAIFLDYLNSKSNVKIYGETTSDPEKRVPTISFVVEGRQSDDVVTEVEALSDGKFGFRWGTFYSVRLCEQVLGLPRSGVVRVSMVHYNTGKLIFLQTPWVYICNLGFDFENLSGIC